MKIQCPHCGRTGSLPEHLAAETQSLRCRRCSATFRRSAVSRQGIEPRLSTDVELPVAARATAAASSFVSDGYFAGWDEDEAPMRLLGPGDSQYELTFTLGEPIGETALDWPAGSGEDAFADEGPSGEVAAARGRAGASLDPWSYRVIASSGRLMFYGGLGLAGLALPLLGFLLARILGDGASSTGTLALVVGSVAALAFLFLSLSMTALNILLVDLARNLQRQRDQAERETGIVRG